MSSVDLILYSFLFYQRLIQRFLQKTTFCISNLFAIRWRKGKKSEENFEKKHLKKFVPITQYRVKLNQQSKAIFISIRCYRMCKNIINRINGSSYNSLCPHIRNHWKCVVVVVCNRKTQKCTSHTHFCVSIKNLLFWNGSPNIASCL